MAKSEPPLKVGFVLDGGLEKPDGVQQYILALGNYLIKNGHQVRYLVAGAVPTSIDGAASLSRSLHVNSNGNRLSIPLLAKKSRLKKYLKEEKFDVLHIQTPYSPMMGEQLILLSSHRTAIIGTFHIVPNSWYLSVGDWLLGKWCYRSLKRFDKMVSVSKAAQRIAKRDFRVDSDVLPNVIDYSSFHGALGLKKYRDDKITILFFGRLVPRKGCLVLLKALNILVNSYSDLPDIRLIVCGSGPLEGSLRAYVSKNKLESLVDFEGYIKEEDKASYYASANLSVFPSSGGESFGIVLLEAMASGNAAVLAGNNEGYASVMESQPQLLFNPNSEVELAGKLHQFIKDEGLRKSMANWGAAYSKNFDVNVVGDKLVEIYYRSVAKRR